MHSLCYAFPFGFRDKHNSQASLDNIRQHIRQGAFSRQGIWKTLSKPCQSFIQSMFTLDPTKRPKAEELLNHAWFTSTEGQEIDYTEPHHTVSPTDESVISNYGSMVSL